KGYAATTLEDIASEAGVTRGAIYWHFGSKAELYNTLVAEMSRRLEQALADVTADGGSPLELLRQQLVRTLEFTEEDEDARAVQELVLFKTAVTPELEAGIEAKRLGMKRWIDATAASIEEAIRAGEVRRGVDSRDAAIAALGLQNGVFITWLMAPETFSLKARAAEIVDLFIQGIAARR